MKISNSIYVSLYYLTAVIFINGLFLPNTVYATSSESKVATTHIETEKLSPEETQRREAWGKLIMLTPPPKKGCFNTSYPKTDWQEVSCVSPPPYLMRPKQGPKPLIVGSGNDISANAPTGFISTAIGSFDSLAGVTSLSSTTGDSTTPIANGYTLQLNTDFFVSTTCAASPNPGCRGWEQFVFFNDATSAGLLIQYWLIRYNTTCPAGWNTFSFGGSTDIYCYRNASAGTTPIPNQPVGNLGQISLSGAVTATTDSATLVAGTTAYSVTGDNSVNAAAGWRSAEFNVFGLAGGGHATFNAGSTVVPRTRIIYGSASAPNCLAGGFTGETNNLSFGPTAPITSAPGPAVIFTESSAGGATSNCAAATTVGDTHLSTLHGLFYDFQASGDFVLAQVGSDFTAQATQVSGAPTFTAQATQVSGAPTFTVQARQVSGAPTWPNASVNNAVATQMGATKVAVCLNPTRVYIDGKGAKLGDGKVITAPDGVYVTRKGDVYFITSESGNSVRVKVHSKWMNATVGFGRWPIEVRGLLANANGNVNQIAARDGTVLTNPFSFEQLYDQYADSWRVPADESLLSVCSDDDIEIGVPSQPFYAHDLEPAIYQNAQTICTGAGVKTGPLLEACILDVAVLGDESAAEVFVTLHEPIAVGIPIAKTVDYDWLKLIIWLLVIIIIILLLWLLFRKK
jgi:hypothetical protein